MKSIRLIYDRVLEAIAVIMIITVTAIVTMGFVYRGMGDSLAWYDEVASVALAWLTYYAGALAALRGAHIGFAGFVNSLPANWRVAAAAFSSAVTIFFFGLLTVVGIQVVDVLGGDTLVSLPWVPLEADQFSDPDRRRAVRDRRTAAAAGTAGGGAARPADRP